MKFQIGAMSVGDILDRSIKLLLTQLGTYYVIHLLVLWPLILLQLAVPLLTEFLSYHADSGLWLLAGLAGIFFVTVLTLLLQPIGTAAVLHIIRQDFTDQTVTIGEALQFAFSQFGTLLANSILYGFILILGFLFFCVPGFYFFVWYVFMSQVVVVENLSGGDALSRSKELGQGFGLRILGMFLLLVLIGGGAQSLGGVLQWVLPFQPESTGTGVVGEVIYRNYVIYVVVTQLLNILAQTYGAICWTLLYFDLRFRKEGYDLEIAAEQFADSPWPLQPKAVS